MCYTLFQNQQFWCLFSDQWTLVTSQDRVLGSSSINNSGIEFHNATIVLTQETIGRRVKSTATCQVTATDKQIDQLLKTPVILVLPQYNGETRILQTFQLQAAAQTKTQLNASARQELVFSAADTKEWLASPLALQPATFISTNCDTFALESIVAVDWCLFTPAIAAALSVDRPVLDRVAKKRLIFTNGLTIDVESINSISQSEYIVIKAGPGRWQHQLTGGFKSVSSALQLANDANQNLLLLLTRADDEIILVAPARVAMTKTDADIKFVFASTSADSLPVTINKAAVKAALS